MTIQELREKRARLWEETKAFLDSHRGEDGLLSAEDDATYGKMEADITALGKEVARLERQEALDKELSRAVTEPICIGIVAHNPYRVCVIRIHGKGGILLCGICVYRFSVRERIRIVYNRIAVLVCSSFDEIQIIIHFVFFAVQIDTQVLKQRSVEQRSVRRGICCKQCARQNEHGCESNDPSFLQVFLLFLGHG